MNQQVETVALDALNDEKLDAVSSPFVCVTHPDLLLQPAHTQAMASFLLQHPDYAAVGPRLVNCQGSVMASWTEHTKQSVLSRVDQRLVKRSGAPLNSRDAVMLSCIGLVVDTEELMATLKDGEMAGYALPVCQRLALMWHKDSRRLRWCGDIEVHWKTGAAVPPDFESA